MTQMHTKYTDIIHVHTNTITEIPVYYLLSATVQFRNFEVCWTSLSLSLPISRISFSYSPLLDASCVCSIRYLSQSCSRSLTTTRRSPRHILAMRRARCSSLCAIVSPRAHLPMSKRTINSSALLSLPHPLSCARAPRMLVQP